MHLLQATELWNRKPSYGSYRMPMSQTRPTVRKNSVVRNGRNEFVRNGCNEGLDSNGAPA